MIFPQDIFGSRRRHEQKEVCFNGNKLKVDEQLANILMELWNRGMETIASCQGDPNAIKEYDSGYILFAEENHRNWFADKVLGKDYVTPFNSEFGWSVRFRNEQIPAIESKILGGELNE